MSCQLPLSPRNVNRRRRLPNDTRPSWDACRDDSANRSLTSDRFSTRRVELPSPVVRAQPLLITFCLLAQLACNSNKDCVNDNDCSRQEICDPGARICVALLKEGDLCDVTSDCTPPLLCLSRRCGSGSAGTVCLDNSNCAPPLHCNSAIKPSFSVCASGAAGDPCGFNDECDSTLKCNHTTVPPVCATGDVGQICTISDQCKDGLICSDTTKPNKCATPSPIGGPCVWDGDCNNYLEGVICNRAFNPGSCQVPGDIDSPCTANTDCHSNLVCAGQTFGLLKCTPEPPRQ